MYKVASKKRQAAARKRGYGSRIRARKRAGIRLVLDPITNKYVYVDEFGQRVTQNNILPYSYSTNMQQYSAFPAVTTSKEFDDQLADYYEPDTLLPLFPADEEQITIGPTNTNYNDDLNPATYSQYDEWSNTIPFVASVPIKKPKPIRFSGVP